MMGFADIFPRTQNVASRKNEKENSMFEKGPNGNYGPNHNK